MLKLAINAVNLAAGGGLTGLLGYLEAWQEIGAALDITVHASRSEVIEAVRRLRPDVRVQPFAVGLPPGRRFVLQRSTLGPHIATTRPDLVLSTNMLVARCGFDQVVQHQNLLLFERSSRWSRLAPDPKRLLQRHYARQALRQSAANVFISEYMRREAESCVPASRPRNRVIPNGLPERVIRGASEPASWRGEPQLVAVTSAEPHKDNATLIRCLATLVARRPTVPWSLAVAGAGQFTSERRLAVRLGVAERVEWLGFVGAPALDDLLRRALCLLHPSRLEGFGLPPLEALARRCPVVAGRSAAIPEVLGDAALLVEPGAPEAFATAACRLADDPALREELIARGIQRIRAFRWVDRAAELLELLQQLAAA